MKIDFIIHALSAGGAERVMVNIANHFCKKHYEIKIITFNEGDDYELNNKVQRIKLHHGKVKNHKIRAFQNLFGFYKSKSNRPDVAVSFITHQNLISTLIAKFYNIPIICSEHSNYLSSQSPNWLTKFTRNHIYPRVNYLTVLTKYDYNYYKRTFKNVVVMPNPNSFPIAAKDNTLRLKTILAVGAMNRYKDKGFDSLLKIAAPVLKSNPLWSIKFIGSGQEGIDFLKKLATELKISEQVIFMGFQNEVDRIMRNSSIFVLSSKYEGLPMALMEALSQGMACVAYDCITGPSEMIRNNYNGFLVEDQNKEEMELKIQKLVLSDDLRIIFGENAIDSLDNFSIENIAKKWEELFTRCTNI